MVEEMYNYFIRIIPGFDFFVTRTYKEWMDGTADPFLSYVKSIDIYHGGFPIIQPVYSLSASSQDPPFFPKNQMLTGKGNTAHTRTFTKYYGDQNMDKFGPIYDSNATDALGFGYKKIWNVEMPIRGTDGGEYGTRIKKSDSLYVFITSLLRDITLGYQRSENYYGLEVYMFMLDFDLVKTEQIVPENANYNQFANGYDGFFNMSSQFGAPVFITFPHCFSCENSAQNMVDYYAYSNTSYLKERIYPLESHDSPFVKVEPSSGSAVSLALNFEIQVAFYKDYFFKNIHEPVPGKGLYVPFYQFIRSVNLTESQVDKLFGTLILAKFLSQLIYMIGILVGGIMILVTLFLCAYMYRRKKFGGMKSPKESMVPLSPKSVRKIREESSQ